MEFEIDVSGEDVLSVNFTVCIANHNEIIKGFKMSSDYVNIINSRFGQGLYRYSKSQKGKATLKVRIYSIIIYYLFKSLKEVNNISLHICLDFTGRNEDITSNLRFFLQELLKIKIENIYFGKLSKDSNAHQYAYLMRKDNKDKMSTYVNINLNDIEKYLKK